MTKTRTRTRTTMLISSNKLLSAWLLLLERRSCFLVLGLEPDMMMTVTAVVTVAATNDGDNDDNDDGNDDD